MGVGIMAEKTKKEAKFRHGMLAFGLLAAVMFGCVVGLPLGTNTPLETEASDPQLFRKNKWLVAHNDNKGLIDRGVLPGISGENFKINY